MRMGTLPPKKLFLRFHRKSVNMPRSQQTKTLLLLCCVEVAAFWKTFKHGPYFKRCDVLSVFGIDGSKKKSKLIIKFYQVFFKKVVYPFFVRKLVVFMFLFVFHVHFLRFFILFYFCLVFNQRFIPEARKDVPETSSEARIRWEEKKRYESQIGKMKSKLKSVSDLETELKQAKSLVEKLKRATPDSSKNIKIKPTKSELVYPRFLKNSCFALLS